MPQARTAGTSTSKPTTAKRTPAKPAAAKAAGAKPAASASSASRAKPAAKSAAAKPAAAKPAAAKTAAAKPAAKRSAAAKPAASKTAAKPAASKAGGAGSAAGKASGSSRPRVNIDSAQIEAIAERLRKLNEKIIEVGREAGESTLASYEKALKTIATGVQQSPAKDEIEWIQHLAASQAKFVREITDSWAKAARDRLK